MKQTPVLLAVALLLTGAGCFSPSSNQNTNPQNTNDQQSTNSTQNVNTNQPASNVNSAPSNTNETTANGNTNTNTGSPDRTVSFTDSGLASFSVVRGATVTFRNDGTETHQISSDPHPAHTDLPGFDLTIQPGQTATFTFNTSGTWGFHDHLNPFDNGFKGKVTVTQ